MAVDNPKLKNGLIMNAMAITVVQVVSANKSGYIKDDIWYVLVWGRANYSEKTPHTKDKRHTPHRALYAACLLSLACSALAL